MLTTILLTFAICSSFSQYSRTTAPIAEVDSFQEVSWTIACSRTAEIDSFFAGDGAAPSVAAGEGQVDTTPSKDKEGMPGGAAAEAPSEGSICFWGTTTIVLRCVCYVDEEDLFNEETCPN